MDTQLLPIYKCPNCRADLLIPEQMWPKIMARRPAGIIGCGYCGHAMIFNPNKRPNEAGALRDLTKLEVSQVDTDWWFKLNQTAINRHQG